MVAPYYPASNERAERAGKTTKGTLEISIEGNWETRSSHFLFKQHTAPSASTGKMPAEILIGRKLCTPFDLLLLKADESLSENLDTLKEAIENST